MCEQFAARAAEPFGLDELWPFVRGLERYGIAGFGWGVTWLAADGELRTHRDAGPFHADPEAERIGRAETTSVLVHLRRPSKLSTTHLPDTQPFTDPAGRFAFGHNGELGEWRATRERYRAEGRIVGRADSEVGERWLEDAWTGAEALPGLLADLHAAFGGVANLAVVSRDGAVGQYAGNPENPVFAFRLGTIGVLSTGLYSIDRSLFQLVAPGATSRRLVRDGTTTTLDERGAAHEARPSAPVREGVRT